MPAPNSAPILSVIGLGKLGIPMVACLAAKGFRVIGVDRDAPRVAAVQRGLAPIAEPLVQQMFDAHRANFSATTDTAAAVDVADITFIIVPTPSMADGTFTNKFVLEACRAVAGSLQRKTRYHLVVITSTVMPGSTSGVIADTLVKLSGKTLGRDFGLCYAPEFIALGSVVRNFLNPDFLLIGECDDQAGAMLSELYQQVCDNHPPVMRMSPVNAELTKIAVNTYVTTKISFANMLASVCEGLPGGDVDVVTQALGLDSRIGPKYLKGAVAFGGPCFPRDTLAFAALARSVDAAAGLAQATDEMNQNVTQRLAQRVIAELDHHGVAPAAPPSSPISNPPCVAILGLAYKPDTDVVECSPGLLLAQTLSERGVTVIGHDPLAGKSAARALGKRITIVDDLDAVVRDAQVMVLTTPWPQYRALPEVVLRHDPARRWRPLIIDCWRMLDAAALAGSARYIALGMGPAQDAPLPIRMFNQQLNDIIAVRAAG
jgi:UDPglucose 6-dehydrogenase